MFKIRCKPMHPLYGAIPVPHVPMRNTRDALVDIGILIRLSAAYKSSQRTFIHLSVSLWNDLADPVFDCVGLVGFMSRANVFSLP